MGGRRTLAAWRLETVVWGTQYETGALHLDRACRGLVRAV